ncbi:MAG: NAD(FAD)-utilizing dehydrogenase [Hyphomicrobiales bacterium]|nr:NAD(FAD)-utilizing dehydrogenase [Hyphomicrobiales bacterium]
MAAEQIAAAGFAVTVYDGMPSPARKFLMAGRGGLNLTHSEDFSRFVQRYGEASTRLSVILDAFPPETLRRWSAELGEETFVGSSGRVFPRSFKASPLLRAWLRRLEASGVTIRPRHRFEGFTEKGAPIVRDQAGEIVAHDAQVCVLALGGASWPRLGSDGAWVDMLRARGLDVASLAPSNCGFDVAWTKVFSSRFAGAPLKPVALSFEGETVRGEATITADGLEGGAVYALSARLREAIAAQGPCVIHADLRPDVGADVLAARLSRPRAGQSASTFLRKAAGLQPVAVALLRDVSRVLPDNADALAQLIKAAPVRLLSPRPIARAISSAGGVRWSELDDGLMLKRMPGVFVCGEMIDWEAPTGGYLLQGCFATGVVAGQAAATRLAALAG